MRRLWVVSILLGVLCAGAGVDAQDVTPPAVSVTAPLAGAMVSGDAVPLRATATDAVGVVSIEFTLDGNPLPTSSACCGIASTTRHRLIALDTTTLTNGSYTVRAIALDAAGNSTTSAARTFTVANAIEPNPTNTSIIANTTIVFLENPTATSLAAVGTVVLVGNPTGTSIAANATIVFLENPSNTSITIP